MNVFLAKMVLTWTLLTSFVLSLCNAQTTPMNTQSQTIQWYSDLDAAKRISVAENKPILLHFSASWCRPCQHLEKFVFNHAQVAREVAEGFVPVKIDVDTFPGIAKQFQTERVPMDVILNTNGQTILKRLSPDTADNYLAMLQESRRVANQSTGEKQQNIIAQRDQLQDRWSQLRSEQQAQNNSGEFRIPEFSQANHPPAVATPQTPSASTLPQAANSPQLDPRSLQLPSAGPNTNLASSTSNLLGLETNSSQQSLAINRDFPVGGNAMPTATPNTTLSPSTPAQTAIAKQGTAPVTPGELNGNSLANELRPFATDNTNAVAPSRTTVANPFVATTPNTLQTIDRNQSDRGVDDTLFIGSDTSTAAPKHPLASSPTALALDANKTSAAPANEKLVTTNPNHSFAASTSPNTANSPSNASVGPSGLPPTDLAALDGDCPVSLLLDNQWIAGKPEFTCRHRGQLYRFASAEYLAKFQQDPDGYSPLLGGFDPVIYRDQQQWVPGLKEHGVFMTKDGKQSVVLFRDQETRQKFREQPAQYLETIRSATEPRAANNPIR